MKKQRFGKLQKWIITECFKVTVLLDRSNLKKLNGLSSRCKHCRNKENITKKRNAANNIIYYCNICKASTGYYCFYREDVLLTYFRLEPDNYRYPLMRKQYFKGSPDNNKAYVSLGRSLANLSETGYLYSFDDMDGIRVELTDKGKEKAIELLDLDRTKIYEPPLLNDEELKQRKADGWKELSDMS